MNPKHNFLILMALIGVLLFTNCGQSAPVDPTFTLDPCAGDTLPGEVEKVNVLTRSFNEVAVLASNTPRDELKNPISELQRIRRDAEDQPVPACLGTLKDLQLNRMNAVIQTLIAFVGSADQEVINQGVTLSRQLHNQYLIELARLLGITGAAPPTPAPFLP